MSNLTDVSQWDSGVYQFATTDPIQGGPGGIDNQPHQNLTNRALWLKNRIAAAIIQSGLAEGTTDNQQLAEAVVLQCATVSALRSVPVPVVPNSQTVLILTRGQVADGDNLGAAYKWVYNSTAADDGAITIEPSTNPTQGRWVRAGFNATALGGQNAGYFASVAALNNAIAVLAPINSPVLTGNPQASTPAAGNRSASLATTQFVNDNFLSKSGISLVWNGNPNTFYKIATLPVNALNTGDSISIKATLNVFYAAANDTIFDGIMGNRAGFSYIYNLYGPNAPSSAKIVSYQESDGSVSVYAVSSSIYAYAYITISNIGSPGILNPQSTIYPIPPATTTPTGTLIFDSSNTTAYPPFLFASAAGAYLTSAIAATTYLPLTGGTLSGSLTLNGGDLCAYRAGGNTGVVYLNSGRTVFLYWDGTKYQLPNGEVFANGYQLARLVSPVFSGTPTAPTVATSDNSQSLATTAYVKNVVASYATLASPAFSGTPTAPTAAAGTNNSQLATTAFVRSASGVSFSASGNGYFIHQPDPTTGLQMIEQWGTYLLGAAGSGTIPFNITFPHACLNAGANPISQNSTMNIGGWSQSALTLNFGATNTTFSWWAKGY